MQFVSKVRIEQRDYILKALEEGEESGLLLAQRIVGQILESAYSDHTKKTYLSWLRGAIRESFPASSVLRLFRLPDENQRRLKREKSQRIQARLQNKTLISLKGHEQIVDVLLRVGDKNLS